MIDDIFVENFVKREKDTYNTLFTVFTIIATVLIILALNVVPILLGFNIIFVTGLASFGIGVLCYFINRRQNVEYEVSVTNDIFTVSRIFYETKRELLAEFKIQECQRIAPTTADSFKEDLGKGKFTLNVTRKKKYEISEDNWYCLVESDGLKYMVIFEFKDKMYKAFRRFNPRNTFFKRIVDKGDDNL